MEKIYKEQLENLKARVENFMPHQDADVLIPLIDEQIAKAEPFPVLEDGIYEYVHNGERRLGYVKDNMVSSTITPQGELFMPFSVLSLTGEMRKIG